MRHLLSGNEAIARGAYEAGVTVGTGYPGTPSTEILENLVKYKPDVYCEWSPNEKVAFEVAAGASLAGARIHCDHEACGAERGCGPAHDPELHRRGGRICGLRGRRPGHALLAKRAGHPQLCPLCQDPALRALRQPGGQGLPDAGHPDLRAVQDPGHPAHHHQGQPLPQPGGAGRASSSPRRRSAWSRIRPVLCPSRSGAGPCARGWRTGWRGCRPLRRARPPTA